MAGADRVSVLPRSGFARARLPPVSRWTVRAELHALDPGRVSGRASPFHLLPRGAFHTAYSRCSGWLVSAHWRGGAPCCRPTLLLSACVQSAGASADEMGGLRYRSAHLCFCWWDGALSDLPSARRPPFAFRVVLSTGPGSRQHLHAPPLPHLARHGHLTLPAVGIRHHHQAHLGVWHTHGHPVGGLCWPGHCPASARA